MTADVNVKSGRRVFIPTAASPACLKVHHLIVIHSFWQLQERRSILRVVLWPLWVAPCVLRKSVHRIPK